jgi:catechol 2,3-dioxygenase-like lactoylglutathione lyase family enzyme
VSDHPPPLARVLESALYVADLSVARDFYRDVLGGRVMLESPRLVAMDIARTSVLLLFLRGATETAQIASGGVVPPHGARGAQHVAFAIARDALTEWETQLRKHGVEIESRVRWPRGGESLYVRDPDGHSIELLTPGLWEIY